MRPLPRSSGILLHPTSLPGEFGIGDLGPAAFHWVETLAGARQSWWQILPLNPTGGGESPYNSYSAFAGNINLLSPEHLLRDGLASGGLVDSARSMSTDRVDFDRMVPFKKALLREAWNRFRAGGGPWGIREDFEAYRGREVAWLDPYARFMAIREAFGGAGLSSWSEDVRRCDPVAVAALEGKLEQEIMMHRFGQFLFDRQWAELKRFADSKKVGIICDVPIFVSGDSSDVWANPELFLLDANRRQEVSAGVPPDYFSEDGQLWGNPLYDWDRMSRDGYAWWIARIRRALAHADLIRLDHFRGFAAAWHIQAHEKTARKGRWVDGPGEKLFDALLAALGHLPLIAEDLGLITADVHALRDKYELPGMRILQFMLGGPDNPYWPHNYVPNTIVYTGTHDNDTSDGWYAKLKDSDHKMISDYLGHEVRDAASELIRLAWSSTAVVAIAPWQDVLKLGTDARMNVPGIAEGNWRWRWDWRAHPCDLLGTLTEWTTRYNRLPKND